jgi:large subunit ribosomal protein L24
MKSLKSRKQRKEYYNAPLHKKRKWISSHLEENLLLKYDRRRVSLIKDDTVKVMRGSFKGHEGKITNVNQSRRHVEVEGLVMTKADGKKIAKPIHPSNLLITKLNLTDRWRRKKLEKNLSDEVKKEIEKEAQEQLIETEKEKRILEEKIKEDKKIDVDEKEKTDIKEKTNQQKKEIIKEQNDKINSKNETPIKENIKNKQTKIKNQVKKTDNKKIKSKPINKEGETKNE